MDYITIRKEDLISVLTKEKDTDEYQKAYKNLIDILGNGDDNSNFIVVKWWALSHKRHYDGKEHKLILPKGFTDIQIQYIIKQQFEKMYQVDKSGFRWLKCDGDE